MRIRAVAVFEGVVHQCVLVDADDPYHPVLEVDALLRPGDADDGPLLLPAPTFMALAGGPEAADAPLRSLAASGRLVRRQEVTHIAFPLWEQVIDDGVVRGPGG